MANLAAVTRMRLRVLAHISIKTLDRIKRDQKENIEAGFQDDFKRNDRGNLTIAGMASALMYVR